MLTYCILTSQGQLTYLSNLHIEGIRQKRIPQTKIEFIDSRVCRKNLLLAQLQRIRVSDV